MFPDKPFDVLAEGLVSKKSRGNKAFELFLAGVRGWGARVVVACVTLRR
jgi:hypothetical protein